MSYPAGWSRKAAGVSPRPHVSSIDAALFGVQLSELLVLRRFGLDAARHARMWPCALTVRAGAAPQEVLDGFPVGARLTQVRPVPGRPLTAVSRVDCVIGNAKVRCEVEHDAPGTSGTGSPGRTWYAEADQVLGPASARYYGMGYQDRSHYVEQVALDGSGRKASAVLTVRPGTDEKRWTAGIGGHYQPALSVLDIMIAFAQLNQVLMYHQDGVRRGQTHTLWLRKLVLTADRPDRPVSAPMPLSAETAGSELVDHAGGRWRTFTMTGSMPGFTGHSMVAHRLPTP